jgi:glycosyltransferase involved in cell wall biosynthesis
MAKVAEIIRFYSLDEIMKFIEKGGEYPLHHVWCYDKILETGIPVEGINYNNKSLINKLGHKLRILNLQQQINLLKNSSKYDLIYAPFIDDIFFLALLKVLGLYKKPILGLGLETHIPHKKQIFKKLRQKLQRHIYSKGIDEMLFFNEQMFHKSNEYSLFGKNRSFCEWGADLDFFDNFIAQQKKPPTEDFIYSTGGTGRDFKTLIRAFNEIDFNLKITTKRDEGIDNIITPNIVIDNSVTPGLHSVGLIRKEYYNSMAVAIPLADTGRIWPVGITVIMEALAMAKPIISTVNPMYPFDLEKEKIGFYVGYNDVKGWKDRVNYLVNNPDEAREMGERGRYLCEKKYNYKLFSQCVISRINTFIKYEEKKRKVNDEVFIEA